MEQSLRSDAARKCGSFTARDARVLTGTVEVTPLENANSSSGKARYLSLVAFVVLCFTVAGIGASFPPDDWYSKLKRPTYAPPNWVFGPVWTALYLMIAVAGWLVWRSCASSGKSLALAAFCIQLVLNAGWSAIFFGLHQPGWALLEMLVLWFAISITIALFKRHSLAAAMLLVPYLAWVTFAAVLNYGFWSLNQ